MGAVQVVASSADMSAIVYVDTSDVREGALEELKKGVSKTSRLVVSGAVIERSNELIELIRFIRTSVPK